MKKWVRGADRERRVGMVGWEGWGVHGHRSLRWRLFTSWRVRKQQKRDPSRTGLQH